MMALLKACAEFDCGEPTSSTYCEQHRPASTPKASAGERGYDWNWQKLSKRARRLQPWCSDCLMTEGLTTDHSPEAWERKAKGLPIRLQDTDVVCMGCNIARGQARGEGASHSRPDPRRQAKSGSLIDKSAI